MSYYLMELRKALNERIDGLVNEDIAKKLGWMNAWLAVLVGKAPYCKELLVALKAPHLINGRINYGNTAVLVSVRVYKTRTDIYGRYLTVRCNDGTVEMMADFTPIFLRSFQHKDRDVAKRVKLVSDFVSALVKRVFEGLIRGKETTEILRRLKIRVNHITLSHGEDVTEVTLHSIVTEVVLLIFDSFANGHSRVLVALPEKVGGNLWLEDLLFILAEGSEGNI